MDTDLVIRAQHGDEEAFASLAVAVGDRLHAVSHRILRDLDLAEDATQQALLAIWQDLPQLRDPARFDACGNCHPSTSSTLGASDRRFGAPDRLL